MNKFHLLLIIYSVFGFTWIAQTQSIKDSVTIKSENDLTKSNLIGQVHVLTERTYNIFEKNGEIEKGKLEWTNTDKFDEKGNKELDLRDDELIYVHSLSVTYSAKYDNNGKLLEENDGRKKATYKYNDKGNKIESNEYIQIYSHEYGLEEEEIKLSKYDDKGKVIWLNNLIYSRNHILSKKRTINTDNNGRTEEDTTYNRDGSLNHSETAKYDNKGKWGEYKSYDHLNGYLISKTIDVYDSIGNILESTNYYGKNTYYKKYNDKGEMIENIDSFSDGSLGHHRFKYNDMSQIIEDTEYNKDGNVVGKITYQYNEKGNKIKESEYNGESSLIFVHYYKYNDQGKIIEESYQDQDGALFVLISAKYDANGKELEYIYYDYHSHQISTSRSYSYDEKGNVIKENTYDYKNGTLWNSYASNSTYTYNDKGILIEQKSYSKGKLTYNVKYDNKGNIIEKTYMDYSANDGSLHDKYIYTFIYNNKNKITESRRIHLDILEVIETFKYDEKGNIIEKKNSDDGGDYFHKSIYKYDNKGNLIEIKSGLDQFYKTIFTFDNKGNPIEKINYKIDGSSPIKTTYKYDGIGNKIEVTNYQIDGDLKNVHIYKYDDKGKIIEEYANAYKSNGILVHKAIKTYKYNKGKIIEEYANAYKSNGSLDGKMIKTYKYNSKGSITEVTEIEYKSDGSMKGKTANTYEYDEIGKMSEETNYNLDGSSFKINYKYDETGNIVEKNYYEYKSDGNLTEQRTYFYKYISFDDSHNWIKKIEYLNDKPHYIIERQIEYY